MARARNSRLGRSLPRRAAIVSSNRDAVAARRILRHRHDSVEQRDDIDRRGVVARQFRVEAGSVGNIADQPVEPAHVVLDDLEQPVVRRASV